MQHLLSGLVWELQRLVVEEIQMDVVEEIRSEEEEQIHCEPEEEEASYQMALVAARKSQ